MNIRKWFNDQPPCIKEALPADLDAIWFSSFSTGAVEIPPEITHPQAMFVAQNWEAARSITPSTTDPIQIQKDFNDQPPLH